MKKSLALLACGVVMFAAIGCGKKSEEGAAGTSSSAQPSTSMETPAPSTSSTETVPATPSSSEPSTSSTPAPSTTEQAPAAKK